MTGKKLLIPVLLIVAFLVAPALALAGPETPQVTSLPADQVIEGDHFAAGEIVEISGTVNGDLYVAGGQVFIDGQVNGDVLAAGGQVFLTGNVSQNARIAAGQLTVSGTVGRNLSIAAGNTEITKDAVVSGNLTAGAGNLIHYGVIEGQIKAGVGNLTLAGSVGNNVEAAVGTIRVSSTANLGGNLTYYSEEEGSIDQSAQIAGNTQRKQPPAEIQAPSEESVNKFVSSISRFTTLTSIVTTAVLAVILIKLYPNYTKKAGSTLAQKLWLSLGIGILLLIIAPILIFFVAITILGLPLAFITGFILFLYVYVARIYAMLAIGNILFSLANKEKEMGLVWSFLLGFAIWYALSLLPFLGGLLKLFLTIAAVGAALLNDKENWKLARDKKIY